MTFGLGISVTPLWRSDRDVDRTVEMAQIAAAHGASVFQVGDKAGRDPENRSNAVLLGWLLRELAGVPRVGALFLVREIPVDALVVGVRTLSELIRANGSVPVIGLMHGRGRADSPGPGVEEAAVALRDGAGEFELWVGAERGAALDRAARIGDVWLANAYYGAEELADQRRRIVERSEGRVRTAVRRDFVCESDSSRAHATARSLLADGYRGGRFDEETMVAGSPDEVRERLAGVAELGFDDILVRPALGGDAGVEQTRMLYGGHASMSTQSTSV
jgi:hypothetical protein